MTWSTLKKGNKNTTFKIKLTENPTCLLKEFVIEIFLTYLQTLPYLKKIVYNFFLDFCDPRIQGFKQIWNNKSVMAPKMEERSALTIN